jgi:hypothetical protein
VPIVAGDILLKLSVKTGSAGNSTAGTPAGSLGKYISTTQISGTALNNIFDDVTGDENAVSEAEYRCIFVHNSHATLTLLSPVAWVSAETAGGAAAAISVDTTAASALANASAQAKEVADENTAPATQTFSTPTTKASGLALSDIPAGQVKAIWIRRTAANTAALDNDGFTLSVAGDTSA